MKQNVVQVDFKRIREHAAAQRWTAGRVARESGSVSRAAVHMIFKGVTKDPTATTLKKICDVIGLPIEDAFTQPKRRAA